MTDQNMVAICQAKIRDGLLPSSDRATVLGGYSDGNTCAACGGAILNGTSEMELEWDGAAGPVRATIHPSCLAPWTVAVHRGEYWEDSKHPELDA